MTQNKLFPPTEYLVEKGADFSENGLYRYSLWRFWDKSKPLVMFIGLNPSTANHEEDDPTIQSVTRISKHNGYGGFYMVNCWAYISTDPKLLRGTRLTDEWNNDTITVIASKCSDVVFAWGNFKVVKDTERDKELIKMFPRAKCITKNNNGSPGHPLYKSGSSRLIDYNK